MTDPEALRRIVADARTQLRCYDNMIFSGKDAELILSTLEERALSAQQARHHACLHCGGSGVDPSDQKDRP